MRPNAPTHAECGDLSAVWGLASSHRFDPSSIQTEDDLSRDARNGVRQSPKSSIGPAAILRNIQSSWDLFVWSDSTLGSHEPASH
ncbi:hypothetical protein CRG98_032177 [Punica granatum]|uniref:Uncharacterized protein n=1 Tax=Punica granatum TaxID=22663 RepID=A0A2I0IVK6_PUNGR|nr:hypothetical protein CRG98_032177 [Punica granatum]